jgi:hypothetical protein
LTGSIHADPDVRPPERAHDHAMTTRYRLGLVSLIVALASVVGVHAPSTTEGSSGSPTGSLGSIEALATSSGWTGTP